MARDFEQRAAEFEEQIFSPENDIFDPVDYHHEFSQGLHGRKIDFDRIVEGTDLYDEWVDLTAESLALRIPKSFMRHTVLVGVAKRTNPFVHDVAEVISDGVHAIETAKNEMRQPVLTEAAVEALHDIDPVIAIVCEDVITKGTNSSSVALSVHQNRQHRLRVIEVVGTVQRGIPERLVTINISYHALIKRLMRDFQPDDCRERGYCAEGSKLISYGNEVAEKSL